MAGHFGRRTLRTLHLSFSFTSHSAATAYTSIASTLRFTSTLVTASRVSSDAELIPSRSLDTPAEEGTKSTERGDQIGMVKRSVGRPRKTSVSIATAALEKLGVKRPVGRPKKDRAPPSDPHLPSEWHPPKHVPPIFMLFCKEYRKTQPRCKSLEDSIMVCREAGALWRRMGEEERKPFIDKYYSLLADYQAKRDEYFKNTDREIFSSVNEFRKSKGLKTIIRFKKQGRDDYRSIPPYIRFSNEYIQRFEFPRDIPCKSQVGLASKPASALWKAMSDEEKKPYYEAYLKERAEL